MVLNMIKKILIGLFAGLVSGFFATGGGMIVVPALVYLIGTSEQKARATSLFVILPMVIASGIFYYRNDYIDWKIGFLCGIRRNNRRIFRCKVFKKNSRSISKDIIYYFFSICINKNDNCITTTIAKYSKQCIYLFYTLWIISFLLAL